MIASLTFALVLLTPAALTSATQDCNLDRVTDTSIDTRALAAFHAAVEEYADLHQRLERALMLDHHAAWPEEGDMESEVLADVIRAARPQDRPGAIVKPDIADLFRLRIGRAVWMYRYQTPDARAEIPRQALPAEPPRVNDWWYGEDDDVPWPSVVGELPVLPEELEYRFLGRHLVLVDPHANLVVDVVENALPER